MNSCVVGGCPSDPWPTIKRCLGVGSAAETLVARRTSNAASLSHGLIFITLFPQRHSSVSSTPFAAWLGRSGRLLSRVEIIIGIPALKQTIEKLTEGRA